jgi:broad specificity phosphatase PhoE
MTTTILLIRHGQTDWNVARRWQGHWDEPLNRLGLAQAHALARRLATWPIRAIYSSDLARAAQTADILGRALDLEPIYDAAWRERHVGDFQGLTSEEAQAQFPHIWAEMARGIVNPPNGEHVLELHTRVTAAFERLVTGHEGQVIAVISHGGALGSVISHVLGIPPGKYGRFSLRGNTGLSIVEAGSHGPRLVLLNDTCHLDS